MHPEEPDDIDDEAEVQEPRSAWGTISEVARGLIALLLFSVAVLTLYVAGGVFFGALAWAAPAVLAVGGAIVLARYLSRRG